MRITRKQLQDLINEEISEALLMSENSRLTEAFGRGGNDIYSAEAENLIRFTNAWMGLGRMVQEQVVNILNDPNGECNPAAIDMAKERIGGMNEEIDAAIAAWEHEYFESGDGDGVDVSHDARRRPWEHEYFESGDGPESE